MQCNAMQYNTIQYNTIQYNRPYNRIYYILYYIIFYLQQRGGAFCDRIGLFEYLGRKNALLKVLKILKANFQDLKNKI